MRGGPPEEVFPLDDMETLNSFRGLAGERFAAAKVNQLAKRLTSGSKRRNGSPWRRILNAAWSMQPEEPFLRSTNG
jgi:hypothetical protein